MFVSVIRKRILVRRLKLFEIMFKYSFSTSERRHGAATLRWEYQTVNSIKEVTALPFENHTGKGKGAPVCVVKGCRGSRSIAPLILNLGIFGGRFTLRKELRYQLNRGLWTKY